ncbi:endonuclease MutS2 [Treponema pectinovorum]|uniref:endonuclease MutS2 n=1 Tax=Treponema pectinovorum TaxID=164 RepID=UPI0011CA561B|nr:Smr/MutS family protein [Treponema pectinovorum]
MWHTKTLEDLAYFRIRDSIAVFCVASESQELFKQKLPLTDLSKIEELKDLSREWELTLTKNPSLAVKPWESIHSFFKILKVQGATLDQEQFYAILTFTLSASFFALSISEVSKELNIKNLLCLSQKLPISEAEQVRDEILKVLTKDGKLKDLQILKEIRNQIAVLHSEIAGALKKYTSDSSLSQVLASSVPVFRAERQLLAVKANMKSRISGIIHEVSSTGQTIFIEPNEVVRKNNELIQKEFELQIEIKKIFTELTQKIAPFTDSLRSALKTMTILDQTCAVALWGIKNNCTYAIPCLQNDKTSLPPQLIAARHPLLGEKAVPIDMKFLEGKNILIITGPNTGGKTVSLKTFALFSLLNQTGFPLPTKDGTRLPVFKSLFADIGDEQSIDQSLSTFSAHMKNIAAAVKNADSSSLVLLDELGSGTDPQEGGAIGMAVLDQLIEKKAFVLVTTHHGILKNYGYTNAACINASVDFDNATLSPTYRLLMGVPGESHALDIAKRAGLPSCTVEKAKSYINNEQADVSTLIKGLTQKYAQIAKTEMEISSRERQLTERELKFEQKNLQLKEREIELKEREKIESNDFVAETHKTLENLVRTLREGEINREKTLSVKHFLSSLSKKLENEELALQNEKQKWEQKKDAFEEKLKENSMRSENGILISKENSKHSSSKKTKKKLSNKEALAFAKVSDIENPYAQKNIEEKIAPLVFKEGAEVTHRPTKTKGVLVENVRRGLWAVQIGSIRMNIKEKDLELLPQSKNKASVSIELASGTFGKAKPEFELRLLGLREEEAIKALERQLDLCQIHNFKNFSIIHGKGNGILQQAVQDYLNQYPAVKDFHYASAEDGGFGKTWVELD